MFAYNKYFANRNRNRGVPDEPNYYRNLSFQNLSFSDTDFSSSPSDSMVYDLFGGPSVNSMRNIWSENKFPTSYGNSCSYDNLTEDRSKRVQQRPMNLPPFSKYNSRSMDFTVQTTKGSPPYSENSTSSSSNADFMLNGGQHLSSPDLEVYNISDMLNTINLNGFHNTLSEQAMANISNLHQMNNGYNYKQSDNLKVDPIWSGEMPQKVYRRNTSFSSKVFLGGLPWDITEDVLIGCFSQFGSVKIEWPGKEGNSQPKGYVYLTFDNEQQVKSLLECCCHDYANGGSWYYRISSRRMKSKEVQVIPWAVTDSNYIINSQKLDPSKTVFVGALHGMINAQFLFKIFSEMFGGVIYAGIDTDKNKYPIGSGRITFVNKDSYMKAVQVNHIVIKTSKFTKKIQVDPYVEDSPCSKCKIQQGPYFCREPSCFRYYCRTCWTLTHILEQHRFITRSSKHSSSNYSVSPYV